MQINSYCANIQIGFSHFENEVKWNTFDDAAQMCDYVEFVFPNAFHLFVISCGQTNPLLLDIDDMGVCRLTHLCPSGEYRLPDGPDERRSGATSTGPAHSSGIDLSSSFILFLAIINFFFFEGTKLQISHERGRNSESRRIKGNSVDVGPAWKKSPRSNHKYQSNRKFKKGETHDDRQETGEFHLLIPRAKPFPRSRFPLSLTHARNEPEKQKNLK